jgi:hypothetical protein
MFENSSQKDGHSNRIFQLIGILLVIAMVVLVVFLF